MEIYQYALLILFGLAISDLIVGVSNDAVNFLNSSIGSKVAPRRVILVIASLGILAGVTFSSGMMEVARKGIFNPQYFTMPDLMVVFLAVMLTDVILLDLYSTYGLPTSTTVSIVFELLGAAVAVALLKLSRDGAGIDGLLTYINTGKALAIIVGILLSIGVAFVIGAVVQFVSRVLFTFNYERRLRRYGAMWGGVALASISYFIIIKGAKGASFVTDDMLEWIRGNTPLLLLGTTLVSAAILQALMMFTRVHILKVVVLVGTFALAMAFAANDLVNFVGVPLAGLSAFNVAQGAADPTGQTMDALQQSVRSSTLVLLLAGAVMVATIWISRKARTVTETTVNLSRQEEGLERFESTRMSRLVVGMTSAAFSMASRLLPARLRAAVERRTDSSQYQSVPDDDGDVPSFDLLRASVNLMVASALIAWATSLKLPLSTTYVTFMVAMGTSLSDQAWGRDSAVFRVTGVLTVVGGWFVTAMMAFTVSGVLALIIFYGRALAVIGLVAVAVFFIARTRLKHRRDEHAQSEAEVFNLRKIKDAVPAVNVTFEHAGIFLERVDRVLRTGFEGLFRQDRQMLRTAKRDQRDLQAWSNIIVANIFKVLRLLQREEVAGSRNYARTISTLQEITESTRDVVMRASVHVSNHHAPLLDEQVEELRQVREILSDILQRASRAMLEKERRKPEDLRMLLKQLEETVDHFGQSQIRRIQENISKTRLNILFYAFTWDAMKIAQQASHLLSVFQDPLRASDRLRKGSRAVADDMVARSAAGEDRLET